MTKQKPVPVSSPGPSVLMPERDLSTFKDLLRQCGPPTFKNARRGYNVGYGDNAIIETAAREAVKRGDAAFANEGLTLASKAYWQMFDDR
jgi:hypothetical protein